MKSRKLKYISIVILLVFSLILAAIIFYEKNQEMKIIFLDVGQGDAILIEQGSNQILIDGGPSEQILLEKLGKYVPFWDRKIELVIATHPDQDHIQGLMGALKNYQVENLMETTIRSESQLYQKYEELIQNRSISKIMPDSETTVRIGGAEMSILSPLGLVPDSIVKDTNSFSIVSRLVFGDSSFLFTGDLPEKEELKLVKREVDVRSNVLKVAHHGSKYSSSDDFLKKVHPREAIISSGKNNRFGHPSMEAMERLKSNNIEILRTDEMGDIVYACKNLEKRCQLVAN
ncbi:MAG: hypothetical protein ACD_15C00011G0002 [uncultured bacterium]|nr:MAG: hypothetical protein ACD_15C00011G0002 [uncultured bacterium]HCU70198.1 hypothetical protein [Candidatus Moranbacteria bacterium]